MVASFFFFSSTWSLSWSRKRLSDLFFLSARVPFKGKPVMSSLDSKRFPQRAALPDQRHAWLSPLVTVVIKIKFRHAAFGATRGWADVPRREESGATPTPPTSCHSFSAKAWEKRGEFCGRGGSSRWGMQGVHLGGFNIKAFTALTTPGPAAAFCLCRFSPKVPREHRWNSLDS